MKRIPFIIGIFFSIGSFSQNLVPNGGFESYHSCPMNNYGEVNKLKNWYDWFVSADYYNCNIGVPNNIFGYQYPNSGSSYIGFGNSERIAVQLIQTLEAGKSYELKIYVVSGNLGNYVTDMGVFLSEDSLCLHSKTYDTYLLSSASPLSDSVNWTFLSTTFTAKGCEKFLGLGIPFAISSYYYFDDVSLECIDAAGCIPPQCPVIPTAYIPNVFRPNKDGVNDEFRVVVPNTELSDFNCTIYNRWGEEVIQINYPNTSWNGKNQKGEDVPDGVYYFFLNYTITECGEWYSDQGYVHLAR